MVKILDLGLAHLQTEAGELTSHDQLMGSLDYMAPEQIESAHEVDARADIYSLGATLYTLLTGSAPFADERHQTIPQKLNAVVTEDVPPIDQRRPDVPGELVAVLDRMLAKHPEHRYEAASEVALALAPLAVGSDLLMLVSKAKQGMGKVDTVASKHHETHCEQRSFAEQQPGAPNNLGLHPERVGTESQPTSAKPRWRRIGWALVACAVASVILGIVIYIRGDFGEIAIDVPGENVKIVVQDDKQDAAAIDGWPPPPPAAAEMWDLGPDGKGLSGILPRRASLAGIRHWQVRFASPPDVRAKKSNGHVRGLHWSPGGQLLAVSSGTSDLYLLSPDGRVVRHVAGHTHDPQRLAWSPDGQRLASTGNDQTVRLWNRRLEPIVALDDQPGSLLSASWDAISNRLATGDSNGKIHVRNADGRTQEVLESKGRVWGLSWSPDGKWLAAQAVHEVWLWGHDLTRGPTLQAVGKAVSIAWSPCGSRLAVACLDPNVVELWTSEWELERTLSGHTDLVWDVAWSPDGEKLASAGYDGTVRIWKADGTLLRVLPEAPDGLFSVSFSPEGLLTVGGPDCRVTAWDPETGDPAWTVAMLGNGKTATFTAAGQLVGGDMEAIEDSLVYVIQPEEGDQRRLKPSEFYTQIPLVPDRDRPVADDPLPAPAQHKVVWHNGPKDSRLGGIVPRPAKLPGITRWQIRFPEPAEPVVDGGAQAVRCVRWTPDGKSLAVADGAGYVRLFAPDGGLERTVKAHPYAIHRIAWSADGRRLASTGKDRTVRLWTRQLQPVRVIRDSGGDTLAAAWDPATGRLATSDSEGRIGIWDADGRPLNELQGNVWLWGLAWSPDGKWLVTDEGIWDAQLELHPPLPHNRESVDFAWSPDGRLLAGACREEKALRIWASDWEPGPILGGHTKEVWGLAWSHDGRMLASASDDTSVRIWQPDGGLLHDLRTHAARVWSLSFAPDGTLVSGSYDQTAIAWDSNTGEPKWVVALLKGGQTATFTAAGQLIDDNLEAVEDELTYVIETDNGELQSLKPSEFFERLREDDRF